MSNEKPTGKLTEEQLAEISLNAGGHSNPAQGHCLLEVVSMFAGEPFSDKPQCVDPVLAAFGIGWNDGMRSDAERAQLKRYITLLPGTNKGPALGERRAFMAMDWMIRVHTPEWLDLSPALAEHAATLRALAPITGQQTLEAALPALGAARSSAAARDAARDAAWDAAWDAAQRSENPRLAAYAFLQPTVERLQLSAHDLYLSMINAELREMVDPGESS